MLQKPFFLLTLVGWHFDPLNSSFHLLLIQILSHLLIACKFWVMFKVTEMQGVKYTLPILRVLLSPELFYYKLRKFSRLWCSRRISRLPSGWCIIAAEDSFLLANRSSSSSIVYLIWIGPQPEKTPSETLPYNLFTLIEVQIKPFLLAKCSTTSASLCESHCCEIRGRGGSCVWKISMDNF